MSAIGYGLSYGWLSARRRLRDMILPTITTATGAFLVVIVFGMSAGMRAQATSLGNADEIAAAVVLIAVTVLLVGVVEVAVATTRTVANRTKELGVLGANGIRRLPVVTALLVEPVLAAVVGAVGGAVLAAGTGIMLQLTGLAPAGVDVAGCALGAAIAVAVSIVAALVTSAVPTWNAASRPPIRSLSSGG